MKNKWNHSIRILSLVFPAMVFSLLIPQHIVAQHPLEIGISVSPGFTFVNFEKALGYSDDYMEDWDQFYIGIAAKGFLHSKGKFQPGAEFGWHKLYYAYYVVPYGSTGPVYREFYVSTFSFMAAGRYSMNRFFVTASAGLHLFEDGVAPALGGEAGWNLSLGDKFSIPLSLKILAIFGDGLPLPVSLGVGFSYKFKT